MLNLLLIFMLAVAPVQEGLAHAFAVQHGHADGGAEVLHASTDRGQPDARAGHQHTSDNQAGHNHAACGAQCFAALISIYSLPMSALAMPHSSLFIPVTGIVLPTDSKPPRYL